MKSKQPKFLIKTSTLLLANLWMSSICTSSPVCPELLHHCLRILRFFSEASIETTAFKRIPRRCNATSAPPIPLYIDNTVNPPGAVPSFR
ncbi:hypothetical protein H5410_029030 [Solanum commersonii]|uniref:Uncharacterized protein n=1 Tax=Solanum commersonii TaxID=4109 RepID=A0A9J5Z4D8_SOLCO|nr:hypothetical protein H5410_029030 [Solanum commersonii]